MSNILITGGNGFIGSHLVDALVRNGTDFILVLDVNSRTDLPLKNVKFIKCDLSDQALIRNTLIDHSIDTVYHLAWASIHETALKDPVEDVRRNVIPSINLFEECCDNKVKKIIFLSSGGTVYGSPKNIPIKEDHSTNPISAYGVSKLSVESYLKMYSYLKQINGIIFRPSVPYGPKQNYLRRQGVITVFLYHALRNEPITVWGDGESSRDFLYIDDMINALILALKYDKPGMVTINLGGYKAFSLNEIIFEIENILNNKLVINYESARIFDVKTLDLDISVAKYELGWEPKISLNTGIKKTIKWLLENKICE
jgi:UDP-glucose 4-epimerase